MFGIDLSAPEQKEAGERGARRERVLCAEGLWVRASRHRVSLVASAREGGCPACPWR